MQQFNIFYLLKDLTRCFVWRTMKIIFNGFFPSFLWLLFIFITATVFSYFKRNFSCIYFQFYWVLIFLFVPGFPGISWNLVIVFLSSYLSALKVNLTIIGFSTECTVFELTLNGRDSTFCLIPRILFVKCRIFLFSQWTKNNLLRVRWNRMVTWRIKIEILTIWLNCCVSLKSNAMA